MASLIAEKTTADFCKLPKKIKLLRASIAIATLYAVTNLELTSRRILSLLSLNSYTGIAGAVTPQMLSKQRTPHTIHFKTAFFSKCHQNSVYGGLRLLQVYGYVNRTVWEEVLHWKSSGLHLALESWPFHVKEFLPTVFKHSNRGSE